ncbi:hypothetical protein SDC9_112710 [bioreactor metagenome]|uniref:Uncharacterized protein n=1 Tax=bioreactor metagenome TaxID=1076179 RepID=A0A645BL21_9ZZZZ
MIAIIFAEEYLAGIAAEEPADEADGKERNHRNHCRMQPRALPCYAKIRRQRDPRKEYHEQIDPTRDQKKHVFCFCYIEIVVAEHQRMQEKHRAEIHRGQQCCRAKESLLERERRGEGCAAARQATVFVGRRIVLVWVGQSYVLLHFKNPLFTLGKVCIFCEPCSKTGAFV